MYENHKGCGCHGERVSAEIEQVFAPVGGHSLDDFGQRSDAAACHEDYQDGENGHPQAMPVSHEGDIRQGDERQEHQEMNDLVTWDSHERPGNIRKAVEMRKAEICDQGEINHQGYGTKYVRLPGGHLFEDKLSEELT